MTIILVTGGCGFIGSEFIRSSIKSSQAIINLDALTYASTTESVEICEKSSKYTFVHGDIRDELTLQRVFKKYQPNVVVHFAAESHVTRSEDNADLFYDVNVLGTERLLKRAFYSGIDTFIHVSTDEVYGPAPAGKFFTENDKIGEGRATSAYALSKAEGDKLVQSYHGKMNIKIVRPTNNFGEWQYPEKFFPRSIAKGLVEDEIRVWGEGNQIRDWLYVKDTVAAIKLVLKKSLYLNDFIYNIGANHSPEVTNLEVAHFIEKEIEKENIVKLIADPRPDHDQRYAVKINKIKRLGSHPTTPPWEDMAKVIKWYRTHRTWWREKLDESEALYKDKEKAPG